MGNQLRFICQRSSERLKLAARATDMEKIGGLNLVSIEAEMVPGDRRSSGIRIRHAPPSYNVR